MAVIIYGEPRLTHDVDLIVTLSRGDAPRLIDTFPMDRFYCPPAEVLVQEAGRDQRGHVNVIHHATGFKADLYFAGRDPLHEWGMARNRHIELGDDILVVAPPEYVIVRKLEFYREGGSEKHLRDIASMLDLSSDEVDRNILSGLVEERGLVAMWAAAQAYTL